MDDHDPIKIFKVGTMLSTDIKAQLITFPKANLDVFAWSHNDISGVPSEISKHRLNVNPDAHPIKYKWKEFDAKDIRPY